MPVRRSAEYTLALLRRKARRQGVIVRSIVGPAHSSFIRLIPRELRDWDRAAEELAEAGYSFDRQRIRASRPKKKLAQLAAYQALLLHGIDFAGDAIALPSKTRSELKESYEYIIKLGPGHPLRIYHERKSNALLEKLSPIAQRIFRIQLRRHSEAAKKWMSEMDKRILDRAVRLNSRRKK